jgi:phage baseplate assembly protein W
MKYIDMPSKFKKLNGEEEPSAENNKAINNSLYNILTTVKGTVPGHPEFGCEVSKYLFELIDPMIESMIEAQVVYAIKRWEPRVKIKKVTVTSDPDYNRVVIKIKYEIIGDIKGVDYEFIYSEDAKQ